MGKTNWDPRHYDANFSFVFEYGEDLISLLNPNVDERVLDLGCGTGQLTNLIHQSGAHVVGLDKSADMIRAAREKYPHIEFIVSDAKEFEIDQAFDAIFSNATLHWVLDYKKCLNSMYRTLDSKGRLVLEFGSKGNISNIIDPLRKVLQNQGFANQSNLHLWFFPSIGEYTQALESEGFHVLMAQHFERPTELQGDLTDWLNMFAEPFFNDIPAVQADGIKEEVQKKAKANNFRNGKWIADYRRIRILAEKIT